VVVEEEGVDPGVVADLEAADVVADVVSSRAE
jgi:hypothetical protein